MLPTTIKFSGHATAHKSQAMQRFSPVSGLIFKRGAPRNRSETAGRVAGYCSVYILAGPCWGDVTAGAFKSAQSPFETAPIRRGLLKGTKMGDWRICFHMKRQPYRRAGRPAALK